MRSLRALPFLTLFLVVVIGVSSVHGAPVDRVSFYDTSPKNILSQPAQISINNSGKLMVWDRGLREYVSLDLSQSDRELPSYPGDLYETNLHQQLQVHQVNHWLELPDPDGFWAADGTFWSFVPGDRDSSKTLRLESVESEREKTLPLTSIKTILSRESHWIIQPDTGALIKWDPEADDGLVDTGPAGIRGNLFAITNQDRYFTHSEREIRVYDGSNVTHSRVFQDLRAVTKHGNNIYVLSGQSKVQKLDSNLSVQFTFQIPGNYDFTDLAVRGKQLVLSGERGLFRARLDNGRRSFFRSSQKLSLEKILGTTPNFASPGKFTRMWGTNRGNRQEIYLKQRNDRARRIDYNGTAFTTIRSPEPVDDLPLNAFQYFQSGSTYWNGTNRLYYFFPDEKTVEAYDRNNQIIRRAQVKFDELDSLRNVQFLGADRDRILFEGDVIYSRLGFRRSVFVFSWDGRLNRMFRLHQPAREPYAEAVGEREEWRYDGDGRIYVLGDDYVQAFDLWGYPGQTIESVLKPSDLIKVNNQLMVLDLNGRRLSLYDSTEKRHYRFGSPLDQLSVSEVEPTRSNQFILSGTESDAQNHRIIKYDPESLQYQTVFRHPNRSLRYPEVSEAGDTLFLWGKQSDEQRSRLFVSDLTQFAAQPTSVKFDVGGSGIHDDDRGVLIVPEERSDPRSENGDTQYFYVTTDRDVRGLVNSESLVSLDRGGFTGYYGVERTDDGHAFVSGYLDRATDTANLRWNTSDTIYQTPHDVRQVLHHNGNLYVALSTRPGFTLLGTIDPDDRDEAHVNNFVRLRGEATWIKSGQDRYFIRHRSSSSGNIAMMYPQTPETGGVQGNLVTSAPADLEGVDVRTDPGGIRFSTQSGGAFSVDGLPVGYIQFMTEGYEQFFSYPVRSVVRPGEFDLLGDVSLELDNELLLLERGLGYFNNGEYRRARIALEAYRDLVEEGPYYRMAGVFLKEIYQRQGAADKLMALYREIPQIFEPVDRRKLFGMLTDPGDRQRILRDVRGSFKPFLNRLLNVQLNVLNARTEDTKKQNISQRSFGHLDLIRRSVESDTDSDTAASPSP